MRVRLAVLFPLLLSVAALADNRADRARLAGTWQQLDAGAGKDAGIVWTLENRDEAIHVIHSENGQMLADFECNTMGRECEIKDSGRQMKISLWFSGPKLVQLETRGSQVVKRRFAAVGDEDTMEVELIPVVPGGKTEVLRLKRAHVTAVR